MKNLFQNITQSISHLLYPNNCLGCATDIINKNDLLCSKCLHSLPVTGFEKAYNNPVEKMFIGRINIEKATAGFYFTKDSLLQHLIKQLKYKNNVEVGFFLGTLLGYQLYTSERFNSYDALIPLPLNEKRQYQRGYNQSEIICKGMQTVLNIPIITDAVGRSINTKTQTKETRVNRWQNIDGAFTLLNANLINSKSVLLVDDVVTTGATLESCGAEILKANNVSLSIAAVACTIN